MWGRKSSIFCTLSNARLFLRAKMQNGEQPVKNIVRISPKILTSSEWQFAGSITDVFERLLEQGNLSKRARSETKKSREVQQSVSGRPTSLRIFNIIQGTAVPDCFTTSVFSNHQRESNSNAT